MSKRFTNKVILITGGTSGIGQATASRFAAEGAQVVITGRRQELGDQIARGIQASYHTDAKYIRIDHREASQCEHSVQETLSAFGRIDILFNNAGIVIHGTAEETTENEWQDTLALNITAVWRMSRLVIPVFRAQGSGVIINNASDWGLVGAKQAVAYCASKGATIQITRAMALDHAQENIRINAVCPGDTFVQRWIEQGYFHGSTPIDPAQSRKSEEIPLGRVAEVDEIASAVLFLASSDASFMTGATLVVDGGNTAQ